MTSVVTISNVPRCWVLDHLIDVEAFMSSTNPITGCQVGSGPILSSIKGHRVLSNTSELKSRRKVVIVEIKKKGNIFTDNVANILKIVGNELGSSPDYVREYLMCWSKFQAKFFAKNPHIYLLPDSKNNQVMGDSDTVYMCILENTRIVIGCLVMEQVTISNYHDNG